MKKLRRCLPQYLLIFLLLGLSVLVIVGRQAGLVLTGMTAKCLCSEVFVAGREPDPVLTEDLSPWSRFVSASVDRDAREVAASFLGVVQARAVYREGLGCILVREVEESELPLPVESVRRSSAGEIGGDLAGQAATDAKLEAVLGRAFDDQQQKKRTRAVLVVRDGRILAERYASGFDADTPFLGWSIAKTVTGVLAGLAVERGVVSLDGLLAVPEWEPGNPRAAIPLKHFLRMASGLEWKEGYLNPFSDVLTMLFVRGDTATQAAVQPLDHEPGKVWKYSSGTANLVSRGLKFALGPEAYRTFPREALFQPLGMASAVMEPDAKGTYVGSSYVFATARDWAKFGLFLLQEGVWQGKRLLPDGWVRWMFTPSEASGGCYGAHIWTNGPQCEGFARLTGVPDDAVTARGHYGQFLTLIPSQGLMVIRFGMTSDWRGWDHAGFLREVLTAVSD